MTFGFISLVVGGEVNFIEPILVSIVVALFCTLVIFVLEVIRTAQEKRFFEKYPYNFIENNTVEKVLVKERFSLYKLYRIFVIDQIKYEAVFYSDVVRNKFGNALLIYKEFKEEEKIVAHLIEYKKCNFNESSLLEELKNIK